MGRVQFLGGGSVALTKRTPIPGLILVLLAGAVRAEPLTYAGALDLAGRSAPSLQASALKVDAARAPRATRPPACPIRSSASASKAFRSPELAKSVKVGDKVNFGLKLQGGAGEITTITKP